MKRSPRHLRSFVLIAVLVIVSSALLVTTSLLFTSGAEKAGATASNGTVQSRALASSGVQAVMARLADQRGVILEGDVPRLEQQYFIYQAGGRSGVARLLPLGPDGAMLGAEGGKLDLNRVDAATLAAAGVVDSALAGAIIQFRDGKLGRPFQSVEELLLVPGVSAEMVHGQLDALAARLRPHEASTGERTPGARAPRRADSSPQRSGPPSRDTEADRLATGSARCLADVVTVHAIEPSIQRSGQARINLNVAWSDELARSIDQRFGAGEAALLKQVFDSGVKFDSEARFFEVMRNFKVPTEAWPDVLDTFTTEVDPFSFGRVDINTAPAEVLQTLPDVGPELAERLVQARVSLSAQERWSVAWPALQGLLKPEAYDALAGRLSSRSWTYRLRIAAGEVSADDIDGPLESPVVYEVVIDLSGSQPRLAYLRDVTLLATAAMLAPALRAAADLESQSASAPAVDAESRGASEDSVFAAESTGGSDRSIEADPSDDSTVVSSTTTIARSERHGGGAAPASEATVQEEPSSDAAAPSGRRIGRWRSGS